MSVSAVHDNAPTAEPPVVPSADYADCVWVAMRLAKDVDTCAALLRGHHVDETRLDPRGLAWALQLRLVRLDATGVDLFFGQMRAA